MDYKNEIIKLIKKINSEQVIKYIYIIITDIFKEL